MALQSTLTRRQLLEYLTKATVAYPMLNVAMAMSACGGGSSAGPPPSPPISDDQFLDQIEHAAFQFFWEQAGTTTGLVKDRALAAGGNDNRLVASIASTGFGLTALCIGHKRGYGDATQIQARVTATLTFLLNQLTNVNGFFYHFLDMDTGARAWNSGLIHR